MKRFLPLLVVIALSWFVAHGALAVTPAGTGPGPGFGAPDHPGTSPGAAPLARGLWLPGPVAWLAEMIGWGAIGYWIAVLGVSVLLAGVLFHWRTGYWPWWCPLSYLGW